MDLQAHTQMPRSSEIQILKHSWGIWGLLSAAAVYVVFLVQVAALMSSGAVGAFLGLMLLGYVVLAIFISAMIFGHDRRMLRDALAFRRYYPFQTFGYILNEFPYTFACADANVLREVIETMDRDLTLNLGWDSYQVMKLVDKDPRLTLEDARSFLGWRGGKTKRGGSIHLLARASQKGKICNLHWWLTAAGVIDAGRVRVFLAWSPFTLLFWIIPWLRGYYNVAAALRQPYTSFYEHLDIETSATSASRVCMDALINVLNKHGIDTSELKMQMNTVVNNNQTINNSGNLSLGNLFQGALNLVGAGAGGAQGAPKRG